MDHKDFAPLHPGEVLLEEFLKPLNLTQEHLAILLGVLPQEIDEIIRNKRSISADTALRLGLVLDTTPEFWLGLQSDYDHEGNAGLSGAS